MYHCENEKCEHLPEYVKEYGALPSAYGIRVGTTILKISTITVYGNIQNEYYCEGCIDLLYKDLKPILDKKLWIIN